MTVKIDDDVFESIQGQVAVITGASRGLGRVYAEKLARLGARVVLIARNRGQLYAVAGAIREEGYEAVCLALDVTDEKSVVKAFAQIESKYGHIDLLINNAGNLGVTGASWELDATEWWRTLELHLFGSFLCLQEALRRMVLRKSGRIINLASHAGAFRWPNVSAYSVAKAAVIKLTENVAVEAKSHGVCVFAFHPGLVRGVGLAEDVLGGCLAEQQAVGSVKAFIDRQTENGRVVNAELGANVVALLASGHYDFLNGRYVTVYDDLAALRGQAEEIKRGHAMTMRIHPI